MDAYWRAWNLRRVFGYSAILVLLLLIVPVALVANLDVVAVSDVPAGNSSSSQ
jgi:hypothetical protein